MKLVILFLAMLIANPALAVTCLNDYDNSCVQEPGHSTAGDCEDLGYSTTIEENCEHTIVCPFNSSYKRCVKLKEPTCEEKGYKSYTSGINDLWCDTYSYCREGMETLRRCESTKNCDGLGFTSTTSNIPGCAETAECTDTSGKHYRCKEFEKQVTDCSALGFTADDKHSWCSNIVTCPTTTQSDYQNWTLCAIASVTCHVGDIFYADGSCSTLSNLDKARKPIGVVFEADNSGKKGKVVSLENLEGSGFMVFAGYQGGGAQWFLGRPFQRDGSWFGPSRLDNLKSDLAFSGEDFPLTFCSTKANNSCIEEWMKMEKMTGSCHLDEISGSTVTGKTFSDICTNYGNSCQTACTVANTYCPLYNDEPSDVLKEAMDYNPGGGYTWYVPADPIYQSTTGNKELVEASLTALSASSVKEEYLLARRGEKNAISGWFYDQYNNGYDYLFPPITNICELSQGDDRTTKYKANSYKLYFGTSEPDKMDLKDPANGVTLRLIMDFDFGS